MAITDIDWGTVTLTNGSTTVTGSGTSWIADDIRDGDTFVFVDGGDGFQQPIVASVQSNTELTLRNEWGGPTLTATAYTLRYQWDSSRVSAMSRRLIMLLDNGNLEALAALTGPGVAVFTGPHSMEVRPFSDFVNGVRFDVQVDTLADRDAYDGQVAGFAVLVSDVGDGRSAIFTKNSNTSGDWSDPAYITGPIGPSPGIEASVVMLPPGSTAEVNVTPISGGYSIDFELPEADGFDWASAYNPANSYPQNSVVRHNRSAFIATQAVPVGESPSNAFPPVDNAYWDVLAAGGANGEGTVSSVEQGSGIAVDDTDPTAPIVSLDATLGDLKDVDLTTYPPENGQTVVWDETKEKWVPGEGGGGGGRNYDLEISQIALKLAMMEGEAWAYGGGPNGNGYADDLTSLDQIDVAGATNLDTSEAGVLKPSQPNPVDQVDTHTGPTSSSGTASASSELSGSYPAWKAFDGLGGASNAWVAQSASSVGTPEWISYAWSGPSRSVGSYSIQATNSDFNRAPRDWTLQGWDGSAWLTLDTRSGQTGWTADQVRTFTAQTIIACSEHRIVITMNNGGAYVQMAEVQLFNYPPFNDLTVASEPFTADAPPTEMRLLVMVEEVDAAVIGDDYVFEVSRDGTDWTIITMEQVALDIPARKMFSGVADVSGLEPGTSLKWRLSTTAVMVKLHDYVIHWRD